MEGKAIAFIDPPSLPPPPVTLLSGNAVAESLETEDMEDWRRFKEAGLLDEAVMERKHRQALIEKASRLEKELFDYQYNMGLLLMEKKEWNMKFDELRQALAEAEEIFKREQSAHLIAFSEAEKREENLRKTLILEKQCVTDLEKALRDLQEEHVQIKRSSELKLADAKALSVGIKENCLEVDEKMHIAEAKLTEINKKSLELDMKLQELEARESMLQKERLSLNSEREAYQATFYKQREDLLEWENKLKKREDRLSGLQRSLDQTKDMFNESDKILEQRKRDLEKIEENINLSSAKLKEEEDDINNRLLDLAAKDKNADLRKSILEMKEQELAAMEVRLNDREKVEAQKLLDEHSASLAAKMQEFELELKTKRKNLDEELRSKVEVLGQCEVEVLHGEEKLRKREEALDKKSERMKEKEKDLDVKLRTAKEQERSMKVEQKKLELEQKKLCADKESLEKLSDDCEKIRAEISNQEKQIGERSKNLKLTNDERLEHLRLRAELKQELEKCRHQEAFLLKEGEDLKIEREKFEKELEVLEAKKAQLSKEMNGIIEEREKFKKLQYSTEERIKKEENAIKEYTQRELEKVKMEQESFEAIKRNEQLVTSKYAKTEHDQMVQELKSQRSTLEADLVSGWEKMEKGLRERERAFQLQRGRELKEINNLKGDAQKKLDELQSERQIIEKEKEKVAKNKEKLDGQQLGMQKDMDELVMLSNKLRAQREQVIRERNHFHAMVEKHERCKNCQDFIGEFILSDLPSDTEDRDFLLIHPQVDELGDVQDAPSVTHAKRSPGGSDSNSEEHISWIRRCTSKLFSFSPKKIEHVSAPVSAEGRINAFVTQDCKDDCGSGVPADISRPSVGTANDSINIPQIQFDVKVEKDSYSLSVDYDSNEDSKVDDSGLSELKSSWRKPMRGRKAGLGRTRSVKAVVEDAKTFLGKSSEMPEHFSDATRRIGSRRGKLASSIGRKRERAATESEQNAGDSEGFSDSVTTGGQRKRRQTVASTITPGQKRYNLRRHKIEGTTSVKQALSSSMKTGEKETVADTDADAAAAESIPKPETVSMQTSGIAIENSKSNNLVKVTTMKHMEFLQDRVVKFDPESIDDQIDATKSVEITELSEEVNDTAETGGEDESGSTINGEDEVDYEDDEESQHPGEVSIGKKIWTFFTT